MNILIFSNQTKYQNQSLILYLLILVQLQKTIFLMTIDIIVMNRILNFQEQQNLFITIENYNENDNNNEEYILENQNENRNENIVHHINENNTRE